MLVEVLLDDEAAISLIAASAIVVFPEPGRPNITTILLVAVLAVFVLGALVLVGIVSVAVEFRMKKDARPWAALTCIGLLCSPSPGHWRCSNSHAFECPPWVVVDTTTTTTSY